MGEALKLLQSAVGAFRACSVLEISDQVAEFYTAPGRSGGRTLDGYAMLRA
jgi:hypothetical protein